MSKSKTAENQGTRAVLASWIGTTMEYYDYACYGLAASLVFAKLFFPTADPIVGTLLALSSFAIGYIARPAGALIFGHIGDRLGRKKVLIVTLTMMGVATFVIGLLPTYAQIGALAPALLVLARVFQGVSAGGEYSGAILMTVEHSERSKRGFRGSLVNTGTTAGLVLANLVFLLVFLLPEEQLMAWGWRIPFLLSGVLVVIGLVMRLMVEESPEFEATKNVGAVHKMPIVAVFKDAGLRVVLVALGTVAAGTIFTLTTVFSLTYARMHLGISSSMMLAALLPATVVILVCVPVFGLLSDRVGVRPLFLAGAASLVVLPFVWFALLDTGQYWWMLLGFALLYVGYSANYAVVPAYFSQVFPPEYRFSGMSIGFTIGVILGNGFAPAIATGLLDATGSWIAIAFYAAVAALISLVAGLFLRTIPTDPEAEHHPGGVAARQIDPAIVRD